MPSNPIEKKVRTRSSKRISLRKGEVNDLIVFHRRRQEYVGWIEKFYTHSVIVRLVPESAQRFGEEKTVVNDKHFDILKEPLKSCVLLDSGQPHSLEWGNRIR